MDSTLEVSGTSGWLAAVTAAVHLGNVAMRDLASLHREGTVLKARLLGLPTETLWLGHFPDWRRRHPQPPTAGLDLSFAEILKNLGRGYLHRRGLPPPAPCRSPGALAVFWQTFGRRRAASSPRDPRSVV